MEFETIKIGLYNIGDGKFMERYIVHRIMKKTADVSIGMSYQGGEYNFSRHYRYPLDLLIQQIKLADYTPFLNLKKQNNDS